MVNFMSANQVIVQPLCEGWWIIFAPTEKNLLKLLEILSEPKNNAIIDDLFHEAVDDKEDCGCRFYFVIENVKFCDIINFAKITYVHYDEKENDAELFEESDVKLPFVVTELLQNAKAVVELAGLDRIYIFRFFKETDKFSCYEIEYNRNLNEIHFYTKYRAIKDFVLGLLEDVGFEIIERTEPFICRGCRRYEQDEA